MLMLSRREGESILISSSQKADPSMTLAELFANGPIELVVQERGR